MKFAKYVGAPFLQNITGQLLLIVAVSIVVKGKLANQTINYRNRKLISIYMSQFEPEVQVIKRAVPVKEQVSEAVVRRRQIRCS